ncbi:hypothetical protein NLX71_18930, partial [Paenibacillus sp. MZ04-78.2]|uniref:hypothetical protein n=1 Tax=Paenibacillus sp. MZ04-78.2 TaxID=2962034 RepID=UPI0020B79D75
RTRTLSLPAPMVLGPQGPGRVGRRQAEELLRILSGEALFLMEIGILNINCHGNFMTFCLTLKLGF